MLNAYRNTLIRMKGSFTEEKRQAERRSDLPVHLIYRPLSFWITPLFLKLGFSAHAVTVFSMLVALSLPVTARWGGDYAYMWVAALCVFFQILDCVDGNIARLLKTSGRVGNLLDSISSLLFWTSYFISVGILSHGTSDNFMGRHGFEIGLGLAVLHLMHKMLQDMLNRYLGERVTWKPPTAASIKSKFPGFEWGKEGTLVEQTYAFGIIIPVGIWGRMDVFLLILTIYQTILLVCWLFRFVRAISAHIASSE
ncbi:MAG: CDP-alcohol phosphatidyltransferase family protein [candidate division Zixibacteria bacterium]|nr:CDP-alcohol phosphatidyltransferase family protein [candidate division Zixibacteria bacterium]